MNRAVVCFLALAACLLVADAGSVVSMSVLAGTTNVDITATAVSATRVQFSVRAAHTGALALAFTPTPGLMPNADAVIGWSAAGVATVGDYHMGTNRAPGCPAGVCLDTSMGGVSNIESATVTEASGVTTMTFTRLINTGDAVGDFVLAAANAMQGFNVALFPGDALGYHATLVGSGSIRMPTFTAPATSSVNFLTTVGTFRVNITVRAVFTDKITVTASAPTAGYIAIGFTNTPGLMTNADAVIGWSAAGVANIGDYHLGTMKGPGCPTGVCLDTAMGGANNLLASSVTEVSGVTTISFTRVRSTGDAVGDLVLAAAGQVQNIIIAVATTDSLSYHAANRVGASFTMPTYIPPAPTTSSPTSSAFLTAFNTQRRAYALANLTWDASLAASAKAYALKCRNVYNNATLSAMDYASRRRHTYTTAYNNTVGENIAASLNTIRPTVWDSQKSSWTCATNTCASGKVCRNFLQIVWGSTTRVGCSGAICYTGSPFGSQNDGRWNFVVCRFNPSQLSSAPFATSKC